MKKIIISGIAIVLTLGLHAGPVSQQRALQVATHCWQELHNTKNVVNFTECSATAELDEIYVFRPDVGEGFVIVPKDDIAHPILGYADEGTFDPENISPEARYWFSFYSQQIRQARLQGLVPSKSTSDEWTLWENGTTTAPKESEWVEPLLQTYWNQSPYYNEKCPYDRSSRERTPTGCIATAFAQIMNKWQYPTHGHGSHSYTYEGSIAHPDWSYGTLSADFANTTYHWDLMPNRLKASSSDEAVDAVATLMYHIGVALEMNYAPNGSGAYMLEENVDYDTSLRLSHDIASENAIPRYFGYQWHIAALRQEYDDSVWVNLLKQDISTGHPIVYGGFEFDENGIATAGHAFVLDGYDSHNNFHVNWGWGGSLNGYFAISALVPGSGMGSYNDRQGALIGFEPQYSHLAMSEDLTIAITDADTSVHLHNLEYSYALTNNGDSAFDGFIGLALYGSGDSLAEWLIRPTETHLAAGDTAQYRGNQNFDFQYECYRCVVLSGTEIGNMLPVSDFDHSNATTVCNRSVGINDVALQPNATIATRGNKIDIATDCPTTIIVSDLIGRILQQTVGSNLSLTVPTKGIYIIK